MAKTCPAATNTIGCFQPHCDAEFICGEEHHDWQDRHIIQVLKRWVFDNQPDQAVWQRLREAVFNRIRRERV